MVVKVVGMAPCSTPLVIINKRFSFPFFVFVSIDVYGYWS